MPRYFFHIVDGKRFSDDEGTELPDLTTARHTAADILADLLRGSREKFWQLGEWHIEIADQDGTVLAVMRLSAEQVI